jgi:hypothetical protein
VSSSDGWIVGDLLACVEGRRKEMESEYGDLLSRLSRTPGARLDVARSRLGARVIYQAATAIIMQVLTGRSAVRVCCLVDGWEALLEESQMHLLEVKVCES